MRHPSLKAYRLSELIFFIKSCEYSMFYTDCSWNFSYHKLWMINYNINSIERRNTSLFDSLVSSKISMLTRAIFIRPDGEIIRESVCACASLLNCLLIEEHVLKSNGGSTKTLTDSIRKRHKKEDLASFV
jgi:hypothetical protein